MKIQAFFLIFVLIISFLFTGCLSRQKEDLPSEIQKTQKGGEKKMVDLSGKKILMVIAPKDFRDEEFQQPKVVFETAGVQVVVASKSVSEAKGALGLKVKIDLELVNVKLEDYEAVVFIGGPGSSVYFNDEVALNLAKEAVVENKVVGAICIGPSILANAGIIRGKRATSFPSEAGNLKDKGAIYVNELVVVDGKIVTAQGPQAAKEFGEKIVQALSN